MPAVPKFNLTEWWKLAEGEKLNKPFDICDELATGLSRALEMVSTLCYAMYRPSNEPGLQRQTRVKLRARTILNYKEVFNQVQEVEACLGYFKWVLER